jgi:hydroxymethylpyrimidine/phosphomethylpyrimidine kinase
MDNAAIKHVLICSGLDPSGGAGFIADCRVVASCGARPIGVVTAHTVQNTQGVTAMVPMVPELLQMQLESLIADVPIAAIKVGMLGSVEVARVIAAIAKGINAPVIWDPVMMPTRGGVALFNGVVADLLSMFASGSDVTMTPNSVELATLLGKPLLDAASARSAAVELAHTTGLHILVKGGHLPGSNVTDVLVERVGDRFDVTEFTAPRLATADHGVHGSGCALSSAIAAYVALGDPLAEACKRAQMLVRVAIAAAVRPGRGAASMV